MGRFRNKIYRFMYGRYGYDKLSKTLLWVYLGLVLTYTVISFFVDEPLFYLIYVLFSAALVGYVFFRTMSRKIQKRRAENERFCNFFRLVRNKRRDRKTHVYRKCPACGAMLRLPRAKGKHTVVCPRCKHRFFVRGA